MSITSYVYLRNTRAPCVDEIADMAVCLIYCCSRAKFISHVAVSCLVHSPRKRTSGRTWRASLVSDIRELRLHGLASTGGELLLQQIERRERWLGCADVNRTLKISLLARGVVDLLDGANLEVLRNVTMLMTLHCAQARAGVHRCKTCL